MTTDREYFEERMRAHGFQSGNRRHAETETSSGYRGPTMLEIALVRRLGNKVKLFQDDFVNIREYEVHRTEDRIDDSVTLEVRDKRDARGKTIDLVQQRDGRYAVDHYQGL